MTPLPRHFDRILMTTDPVGGVWNFTTELCRGFGEHGLQVILAVMGGRLHDHQREEIAALPHVEVAESTLRLEWMEDPWHDLSKAGTWLEWLEAQFAPDLIHLNGYAHASLPWSARVVVTGHSDVLSWWRGVRGEAAPAQWADYAEVVRQGLHAADFVTAPSRAMLTELEKSYGALRASRVVYNGRDPRRYFSGHKEPMILCVGRLWDEAKNVRMLATVAGDLPWPVQVAGDATAPDGMRVELKNVEVLGRCSEEKLVGLYSRASIYALPARYEPFGLSVLEAGLAGCALVLGDIGSLREIWGDAAIYVEPNDSRALRAVLALLISDPERRNELGRRAQLRAREYSRERMVREYLTVYTRATASDPIRSAASFPA